MNTYINKIFFSICLTILIGCSDRSQIEGLVFSDKVQTVDVNKEITVSNNNSQSYIGTLRINDTDYNYTISYYKILYNNGTIQQYLVSVLINPPLRFAKSNGGTIYSVPEGISINSEMGYFSGSLPIINYYNNTNNAANTVKLDETFYIGFNIGGNTEFASYGWLKLLISKDKITIFNYGYKTGNPINARKLILFFILIN